MKRAGLRLDDLVDAFSNAVIERQLLVRRAGASIPIPDDPTGFQRHLADEPLAVVDLSTRAILKSKVTVSKIPGYASRGVPDAHLSG